MDLSSRDPRLGATMRHLGGSYTLTMRVTRSMESAIELISRRFANWEFHSGLPEDTALPKNCVRRWRPALRAFRWGPHLPIARNPGFGMTTNKRFCKKSFPARRRSQQIHRLLQRIFRLKLYNWRGPCPKTRSIWPGLASAIWG